MEQFSLAKYLANTSRKVVTRCGYSVRILCTDKKSLLPIVALIADKNGDEFVVNYNSFGKYNDSDYTYPYDLFFTPEKGEGWINIYRNSDSGRTYTGGVYDSQEDAEKRKAFDEDYVTTIKIKWEK